MLTVYTATYDPFTPVISSSAVQVKISVWRTWFMMDRRIQKSIKGYMSYNKIKNKKQKRIKFGCAFYLAVVWIAECQIYLFNYNKEHSEMCLIIKSTLTCWKNPILVTLDFIGVFFLRQFWLVWCLFFENLWIIGNCKCTIIFLNKQMYNGRGMSEQVAPPDVSPWTMHKLWQRPSRRFL